MRVLILGASGMLGHKLAQRLAARGFEITATIRDAAPDQSLAGQLPGVSLLPNVIGTDMHTVEHALTVAQPQVVINCIGIIKQLDQAKDPIPSISINALLPHLLSKVCEQRSARLIHFSTDCVFSGACGPYHEDSVADASDLYGRTKLLGEVSGTGVLTLRSSIIGPEIRGHHGLVDWFLSQRGRRIRGFSKALYSGLTTRVMADLVGDLLVDWPDLAGVWQVASQPISKYDLLVKLRDIFGLDVIIERDVSFFCDRRLDGSRFHRHTGWSAPAWQDMAVDLATDYAGYALPPR